MLALKNKYEDYRPFILMVLTLLPLFFISLYAPLPLVFLITIITIIPFYYVTNKLQMDFFKYDKRKAFLYLVFPIEILIVLWGSLLVKHHRVEIFTRTLCIFFTLVICAISPILRRNQERLVRRIKYIYTYTGIGVLVGLSQFILFLRAI